MHVVGVRVVPVVRAPALVGGVRTPDLVIPDHVHDSHTAGEGELVALIVRGEQRSEEVVHRGLVGGVADIGAPVERTAFLVLALAADVAVATYAEAGGRRVTGQQQVAQRDRADLRRRVAR